MQQPAKPIQIRRIEVCQERSAMVLFAVYDQCIIDYAPGTGFRKFASAWVAGIWHRSGDAMKPLAEEIRKFKTDVLSLTAARPEIQAYVSAHSELRA
jgi:hypothetical protein